MLRVLVGVLGLLEFLFPRTVIAVSTRLAYRAPEEFEVKPWVVTMARLEGLVLVLLALRGCRRGARSND
jgi:hypothetical protein